MDDLFEEGQMAKVYNRAYDIDFNERHSVNRAIQAGVSAVAEWARKQTLEECADLAMSNWVGSTNTQGMSYEDAAAWEQAEEIASAIRALGTPGEES